MGFELDRTASNSIELDRTRSNLVELEHPKKRRNDCQNPMNYREWSKSRELARTFRSDLLACDGAWGVTHHEDRQQGSSSTGDFASPAKRIQASVGGLSVCWPAVRRGNTTSFSFVNIVVKGAKFFR